MRRLKRVVIKEELVALTGDIIEAIILNQFLYWSERIEDFDRFIIEEKERAQANGINLNFPLTNGWIYKKISELKDETMLTDSEKTIRRKVQNLVKKGFLQERQNPLYNWDKTLQYRVNLIYIAKKLHEIGYKLEGYKYDLSELVSGEQNRNFDDSKGQIVSSEGQNDDSKGQIDDPKGQNDAPERQIDAAIPIDYNTIDYNTEITTIDYNTKTTSENISNTTLINHIDSIFNRDRGNIGEKKGGYRGKKEGKKAMVPSAESYNSADGTVRINAHTTSEKINMDSTTPSNNSCNTNNADENNQSRLHHCREDNMEKPGIRIFLVTDEEDQEEGMSSPGDVNNLLKSKNNTQANTSSTKEESRTGTAAEDAKKEGGRKASTRRSTKSQHKDELKAKAQNIFQYWLSKGIIPHESLTRQALNETVKVLEVYNEEQIKQAIDNYAYVLKHPERFWWTYVYSFKNFITKGLEQFMDRRTVMKNYLKEMSPIEKMQKFAETGDWRYLVPERYEDTMEYAAKKALAKLEGKSIDEVDFKSPLFDYDGLYDEDGFLKFPEDDEEDDNYADADNPDIPDIFQLWSRDEEDDVY
ncbi:hypothetical protein [Thermoanaerobacter mathranii]|uniref:hypothetical protein n=1 Tax=Thermoanaerobacter mathranii TaxID=583357 RepID=UPI003D6A1F07